MLDFLKDPVLPLLGTFAVGVAGWLLTHFALNPLLRFHRLRESAHEEMEYTANVSSHEIDPKRYDEAEWNLRRLSTKLAALRITATPPVRLILGRLGYDLEQAAGGLMGLSNSLSDKKGGRAYHRWEVEKGLKLPMTYKEPPEPRD